MVGALLLIAISIVVPIETPQERALRLTQEAEAPAYFVTGQPRPRPPATPKPSTPPPL